jgi:hypothetical protein
MLSSAPLHHDFRTVRRMYVRLSCRSLSATASTSRRTRRLINARTQARGPELAASLSHQAMATTQAHPPTTKCPWCERCLAKVRSNVDMPENHRSKPSAPPAVSFRIRTRMKIWDLAQNQERKGFCDRPRNRITLIRDKKSFARRKTTARKEN